MPTPALSLIASAIFTATSFSTTLRTISFSVSIVIPSIVLGFATEPLALIIVAPVAPSERAISTTSEEKPAFVMI